MEKGFFEVFSKYDPTPEKRAMLERGHSAIFRYAKNPMRVEVQLTFDKHEDPELIYEIEDECREFYGAESFKIIPHFPPEEYNISRFDEITAEAALCGAVTNGFFSNAEYTDDGETITAHLPFSLFGVDFVKNADTEAILSRILESRYGIKRNIKICTCDAATVEEHSNKLAKVRERLMEEAEKQSRENFIREREQAVKDREEAARQSDPHYDFDKKSGISSVTGTYERVGDTTFRVGASTYNISESSVVYGEDFDLSSPTPLADIESAHGNAVFLGTVFSVETKETRSGDKTTVTVGLSDGASATYAKKSLTAEELDWVKKFKSGAHVAVFGRVIRDKFDNEPFISFRGIKTVKRVERTDTAEEKRVELHLHSNMSQMDAVITPAEIVNTAIRWGHKAIAVTDHGNVQAFPEVMLALEKSGNTDLKVLYGIEGYFANDLDDRIAIHGRHISFFE